VTGIAEKIFALNNSQKILVFVGSHPRNKKNLLLFCGGNSYVAPVLPAHSTHFSRSILWSF